MKFGQLIEQNKTNITERSYTKYAAEASPRPCYKKQNLNISLNQQSEIPCSLFFIQLISKSITTKIN